jgi:hypothetical protein
MAAAACTPDGCHDDCWVTMVVNDVTGTMMVGEVNDDSGWLVWTMTREAGGEDW